MYSANDIVMSYYIGYCIAGIIWGIIWGFATNAVIHNKGYDENWFWWGFFFSFIALIVAATKPENRSKYSTSDYAPTHSYSNYKEGDPYSLFRNPTHQDSGGWLCLCGRSNAGTVGTCACGRTKSEVEEVRARKARAEEENKVISSAEVAKKQADALDLENLKKLKDLLDSGIITQDEFDKKKEQILGL